MTIRSYIVSSFSEFSQLHPDLALKTVNTCYLHANTDELFLMKHRELKSFFTIHFNKSLKMVDFVFNLSHNDKNKELEYVPSLKELEDLNKLEESEVETEKNGTSIFI